MDQVTQYYIDGIKEARSFFDKYGKEDGFSIQAEIDNIKSTLKGFTRSSPVGQMLQGQLEFWINQKNKHVKGD